MHPTIHCEPRQLQNRLEVLQPRVLGYLNRQLDVTALTQVEADVGSAVEGIGI